jgi:hypothetical protein
VIFASLRRLFVNSLLIGPEAAGKQQPDFKKVPFNQE